MTIESLADVARAIGFELVNRDGIAKPIGIDYEHATTQTQYALFREGDEVAFDGTARECTAFLIGWRERPYAPWSPSPIDLRRLHDGAVALSASNTMPRTRVEAEVLLEQISNGIRAMQSLDDLGEDGNRRAMRDLNDLSRRYEALKKKLKELP